MKAIGFVKFEWWGLEKNEEKFNYINKVEIDIVEGGFKKTKQTFTYPSLDLCRDELIDGEIYSSVKKDVKQRAVANFDIHETNQKIRKLMEMFKFSYIFVNTESEKTMIEKFKPNHCIVKVFEEN